MAQHLSQQLAQQKLLNQVKKFKHILFSMLYYINDNFPVFQVQASNQNNQGSKENHAETAQTSSTGLKKGL